MKRVPWKPVVAGSIAISCLALIRQLDLRDLFHSALVRIADLGIWSGILFICLYIGASVLFVPGSILTLGAGVIFGIVRGSLLASAAATLGAAAAFLAGRYFARAWVARKIEADARFQAIDQAVGEQGWKIVFLTRLSPVFPFNLLNYAFGLSRISFWPYFFASWLGMLPGTVLYVYVGSLAGSIANASAAGRQRTSLEWGFYAVGLIATVVITVFITRLARQALRQRIPV